MARWPMHNSFAPRSRCSAENLLLKNDRPALSVRKGFGVQRILVAANGLRHLLTTRIAPCPGRLRRAGCEVAERRQPSCFAPVARTMGTQVSRCWA
jgi:hypothetical protein